MQLWQVYIFYACHHFDKRINIQRSKINLYYIYNCNYNHFVTRRQIHTKLMPHHLPCICQSYWSDRTMRPGKHCDHCKQSQIEEKYQDTSLQIAPLRDIELALIKMGQGQRLRPKLGRTPTPAHTYVLPQQHWAASPVEFLPPAAS